MAFSNVTVYHEEWEAKLQERLNYPQNWKEVCDVVYTNDKVIHRPYQSTTPSAASLTRGTAFSYSTFGVTDASLNIATPYIYAMALDSADLAQQTFVDQMMIAEQAGTILNEQVEAAFLGTYASFTTFDNTQLGGSAGNITVSASNIDNIIRAMKREISEANGDALAARNGMFIIWRAADFEKLEEFCQANGFNTADHALLNGALPGFHYAGVDHYVSNKHTAGKVVGGVKKVVTLGILSSTYGKLTVVDNPYADTGVISGKGFDMRVDYGIKVWEKILPVIFNITVV